MVGDESKSRVVPLRSRKLAETLSVLASAAGYDGPAASDRVHAGVYPVKDAERDTAATLYAKIRDPETRQALLDVLMAIARNH